jgi:4-hydroxy-3-methylbut-2-enyl diphosphate reductase
VILIGHAGHPEVVGTMGQLPPDRIVLVENTAQAESLELEDPDNLAYVTQTTLSVDDTAAIVDVLRRRFPRIDGPRKEDICYATTNRQTAVKAIARDCDAMIVIGAPYSSNSKRLAEVARTAGCAKSILIQSAAELDFAWLEGVRRLGVTAGASAPEVLVQEMIDACRKVREVTVEEVNILEENVEFSLPRVLTA